MKQEKGTTLNVSSHPFTNYVLFSILILVKKVISRQRKGEEVGTPGQVDSNHRVSDDSRS